MAALCCECQTSCVSAALALAHPAQYLHSPISGADMPTVTSHHTINGAGDLHPAASLLSIKNTLKTYLHN